MNEENSLKLLEEKIKDNTQRITSLMEDVSEILKVTKQIPGLEQRIEQLEEGMTMPIYEKRKKISPSKYIAIDVISKETVWFDINAEGYGVIGVDAFTEDTTGTDELELSLYDPSGNQRYKNPKLFSVSKDKALTSLISTSEEGLWKARLTVEKIKDDKGKVYISASYPIVRFYPRIPELVFQNQSLWYNISVTPPSVVGLHAFNKEATQNTQIKIQLFCMDGAVCEGSGWSTIKVQLDNNPNSDPNTYIIKARLYVSRIEGSKGTIYLASSHPIERA